MSASEPDTPHVDAIVVVYGPDPALLHRCVDSLVASRGVQMRVILVDNGSPQPVHAPPGVHRLVRRDHNGGLGAAVNTGWQYTSADAVLLLNDDAWVEPDAVRRCVDRLQEAPDVLVVAPKVLMDSARPSTASPTPVIDSCGLVIRPDGEAFSAGVGQPDIGQFDDDRTCLGACFAAALLHRRAWQRVGPVDERYFLYYEDVDWALRAAACGVVTALEPAAVVHHVHAASTRRMGEARRFAMVQRNLLRCATANVSVGRATRIWAGRLAAHGKGLITGPYRTARLRAIAGAVCGLPSAVAARRRRTPLADEARVFAFAEGLRPHIVEGTFVATASQQAADDAAARLRRRSISL
jgi:GT2 family glycosyltransferase